MLAGDRSHSIVADAHALLCRDDAGRLEQESALADLAGVLFADQVKQSSDDTRVSSDAVARARSYIDAHFADGFGLGTLSTVSGISVFHLARSFRKAVGITPLRTAISAASSQHDACFWQVSQSRRLRLMSAMPIKAISHGNSSVSSVYRRHATQTGKLAPFARQQYRSRRRDFIQLTA
ncbi:AraC family transcriptional regulator [Sphingomonas sp. LR59]|uniref:AraC family transcriptional regulator n=1 Tax=Sphingomonas sp. LR59 TaxID=3050232 RepID=UPI002FE23334